MEELTSSRNNQRQLVIEVAAAAFRTQGIKSVTMDDIAHRLTMSKRTLYQLFRDKEELLLACVERKIRKEGQFMEQAVAASSNVMETLLRIFSHRLKEFGDTKPGFFLELKEYPAIMEVHARHSKGEEQKAVNFMQRGIEQGIFRNDVDFHLVVPLLTGQLRLVVGTPAFHNYHLTDIFLNTIFVVIRGCATDKGAKMMDDFIVQLRQEQEAEKQMVISAEA